MQDIKCNLCGYDRFVEMYHKPGANKNNKTYLITQTKQTRPGVILKCLKCGLVFAMPDFDKEELFSLYANMRDEQYTSEEQSRRVSSRRILEKIGKFKRYGNKLLDVGCSVGFLLDEAKKQGWDVCGVELSLWASNYAREKYDLEVHNCSLEKANLMENCFDVIVMQDTIEHLTDPKQTLERIRKLLKPTGILYINTPNINSFASRLLRARWWGINQFHLFYFSKKTLSEFLDYCGFKCIKYGSYARTFTLGYWAERLKGYNNFVCKFIVWVISRLNLGKVFFTVNFGDQVEVFAGKKREIKYLEELEMQKSSNGKKKMKVVVVMPAYNASKTLKKTYEDIPKDCVDEIILVDDASSDNTPEIAQGLGIKVFVHEKNKGYGANQKTCYKKALEYGADIIIMVHPDYQYDPKVIPQLVEPIKNGTADVVFGSRMIKGGALLGGMPGWKHNANILLTAFENVILGTYLTEYHSGFRAYSAKVLNAVNFEQNSDGFIFDTEIVVQILLNYFRIEEIPIRTRYFDEASSIKFLPSLIYGLGIFKTMFKYLLHIKTVVKFKQFKQK